MHITPDMQPDMVPVSNAPLTYRLRTRCRGVFEGFAYDIPEGFESDGMTIPRVLWTTSGFTPDGVQRLAALIHDWCYSLQGNLPTGTITRAEADTRLRAMCEAAGIPKVQAFGIYEAVDKFGWMFWGRHHLIAALHSPHTTLRDIERFAATHSHLKHETP